ncbi:MAG: hypothetical protein DBX55_07665 [Verrucomicrobia bacterium]|nr:MAG: hypothetical protein DBX55_07665 [Verrucomicrobiota bacterium]
MQLLYSFGIAFDIAEIECVHVRERKPFVEYIKGNATFAALRFEIPANPHFFAQAACGGRGSVSRPNARQKSK